MKRKNLLILCISIEQMKNTIGHKDLTNEAAAERRLRIERIDLQNKILHL